MDAAFRAADIAGMLPLVSACLFGMLVLLFEAFQRPSFSRAYLADVSALGFGVTGLLAWNLTDTGGNAPFGGIAVSDPLVHWTTVILCLGGALVSLSSTSWFEERRLDRGEFHALLHLGVAGMIAMVAARDLVVLFVALEIASVCAYALTSFLRSSPQSAEAGFKYFVLGALASAVLLYGIALLYGATGSTSYLAIAQALEAGVVGGDAGVHFAEATRAGLLGAAAGAASDGGALAMNLGGAEAFAPLGIIGMILLVAAVLMKLGAAPFHAWAPDAYTGAPTPVVAFLSATLKVAWMAALARLVSTAFFGAAARGGTDGWVALLMIAAVASIVLGNTVALTQHNVKRILAFSSIAHAGYLLVGLAAVGYGVGAPAFGGGLVYYFVAYTLATVGAFAVLSRLGARGAEVERLDDLAGLGRREPGLAVALSVFLLSSAGIPPTAGFIAKLLVLRAAFASASLGAELGGFPAWPMLVVAGVALIGSVVGAAYYLRVVALLFLGEPTRDVAVDSSTRGRVVIAVAALLTLALGVLPGAATRAADAAFLGMLGAGGAPQQELAQAER